MNSEGSEPKSNPEEESIFNRPRKKLKLAEFKNKPEETEAPPPPPPTRTEKTPPPVDEKNEDEEKKEKIKEEKRIKRELRKKNSPQLISIKETFKYMKGNSKLLLFSMTVALIMIFVSIFLYHGIFSFMKNLTAPFYSIPPITEEFFDYFHYAGWVVFKFFFQASITIFVFYVTFLISYLLCAPLYSFLSYVSENVFLGKPEEENDFDISFVGEDYFQAVKISGISIAASFYLFFVNFVPVIGQILVFAAYPLLNTLLITDFSAARKDWSIVSRILWMKENPVPVLMIGCSLTIVSIIPQLNNIAAALLIPFLIVFSSLNIISIEKHKEKMENNAESA